MNSQGHNYTIQNTSGLRVCNTSECSEKSSIPVTCFGPIFRAMFRLIFKKMECTVDNAFNFTTSRITVSISIKQKINSLPSKPSPPN